MWFIMCKTNICFIKYKLLDTVKIGSGELLDFRLLDYLVKSKISIILSTGMSSIKEIETTNKFLTFRNSDFCFLHCVSEYPPLPEDICLDTLTLLIRKFPELIIGFSCHTPDIFTSLAAVTLGAKIVEKHVILDKNITCPDQSVSLEFPKLLELTQGIQAIVASRGIRENVLESEMPIRDWARRVLVAKDQIPQGAKLDEKNMTTLRAGNKGISSEFYFDYIGKKSIKNISPGDILLDDDFQ